MELDRASSSVSVDFHVVTPTITKQGTPFPWQPLLPHDPSSISMTSSTLRCMHAIRPCSHTGCHFGFGPRPGILHPSPQQWGQSTCDILEQIFLLSPVTRIMSPIAIRFGWGAKRDTVWISLPISLTQKTDLFCYLKRVIFDIAITAIFYRYV